MSVSGLNSALRLDATTASGCAVYEDVQFEVVPGDDVNKREGDFLESDDEGSDVFEEEDGREEVGDDSADDEDETMEDCGDDVLQEIARTMSADERDAYHRSSNVFFLCWCFMLMLEIPMTVLTNHCVFVASHELGNRVRRGAVA